VEGDKRIEKYEPLIVELVREVNTVVKEKEGEEQLSIISRLYTKVWTPISSSLATDFNNDPKILELREEIDKCFRHLLQETAQENYLRSAA